jgi:transposase
MTDTFPELRKVYFGGKERPGNKPKDVDLSAVIRDILGGMSIRQAAPKYGISHVSLGRKLKQTTNGAYAVEVATARALDMNAAKKAEAKKRREVR